MKINNIDTAPIYTKIYDKPIKKKPKLIKYIDIVKNKPIKNKIDTIGFFIIITNILKTTDTKEIKIRDCSLNP